jgi:Holliday junction resolvase RusA-like endonuclease
MITLELPWPPSVNHYYKHVGNKVLISKEGRQYREVVANRIKAAGIKKNMDKVEVAIQLYPPDRRRRDVDNVLKCLLDSFTIGGIYDDDSQIYFLSIEKLEPMPPDGMAVVKVFNYEQKKELPEKERNCTIDSNVNAV